MTAGQPPKYVALNSLKSLPIKISTYYQGLTQNPVQEKSGCVS